MLPLVPTAAWRILSRRWIRRVELKAGKRWKGGKRRDAKLVPSVRADSDALLDARYHKATVAISYRKFVQDE
jgi:hypothetical protein